MPNALFAFHDRQAARQALDALVARGLSHDAVEWHAAGNGPNEGALAQADELVTGGLVGNMAALFQGIFDWGGVQHDGSAFTQVLRRGGAVLKVQGGSEAERSKVEEVMALQGPAERTGWSERQESSA